MHSPTRLKADLAARARRAARGPVRDAIRDGQSVIPVLAGRRRPGPPDFVGIGAQRCGTSWWQSLIEQHPGVTPLGLGAKELHFFDELWAADLTEADIARYHAQFLRGPGRRCGEWTPRYLPDPWAVPAVLRAAPQTKLLVMLRDPLARFASAVRHAQQRRGGAGADIVTDAYQRGLYAAQLERVLALVPRSQLLVLQFERCVREQQTQLARTFDFLELPPAEIGVAGSRNATAPDAHRFGDSLLGELRERYHCDAERLANLFPDDIDIGEWTQLRAR